MSNQTQIDDSPLKGVGPLQIGAELVRVRRRASARLGAGIGAQAVEMMLSKLDHVFVKEKERR